MIITKSDPFTKEEIENLRERFDIFIKTVIDIEKRICCAGMARHFEGEEILLNQGSKQKHIWGGGVDLKTKLINYDSFINIRPNDNNPSNEILDPQRRKKFEELTRFFFKEIYE